MVFTQLSSLKQLDVILEIFKKEHPNPVMSITNICTAVQIRGFDITVDNKEVTENLVVNIKEILLHLITDKYVDFIKDSPYNFEFSWDSMQLYNYKITFAGRVFEGYQRRYDNKDIERKQIRNSYLLTWVLGIGVIIPSIHDLVEICQHRTENINLTTLTLFHLFFSGILTGIAILLLAKEVLSRRSK